VEREQVTDGGRVVPADGEGARRAAEWLLEGGVAVVPTDTVYGLAARPVEADAVNAIYRMKERPEGMHLPVLAASVDQVHALGVAFTPAASVLARRWWPGPLTLAFGFESQEGRPGWLDGRVEVAVRIPDHDFLRALLKQTGVLVVTSANPHGAPTPRNARDVVIGLGSAVDLVIDGGELRDVPSTLVNVSGPEPTVEREGAIPRDAIASALQKAR
jgi:L-threonylcarbamoyladenylate synthase